ncbi:MBOAT, membrane-bound O-acyltransferase family-domain-containing protein [Gamsiella multidivaricata]|uniref:MBOAT, membrane-bound O-acyltransferase family-domain-containing protein n=1 Tax=Gamsiella multidivaricata TaxID=101098 RepID=UPI00221E712B|nr:MBOAT, membrane-bound O-acyltransferase family-domain-containing protein [Gamsiella multidivaricata]KAI7831233.1 MBOAT, membrane-bound O-acyltransferase family-domain-containing protein [Gamsiella multidivaricata]
MTGHQQHEHHPLLRVNHQDSNDHDATQLAFGASTEEASSFVGQSQPVAQSYVHKKRYQDRSTNPSLWNTKEFYFYYFVFITCVPYMFKTGHDASSESNPNYDKFKDLLSDGWFGYKVDNSDEQYANFRNNLPVLAAVMCIYVPLSHLYRLYFVPVTPLKSPLQPLYRAYFFLAFSAVYLYFMYGNSILKIGAIVTTNYAIAKLGGSSRMMPVLTWIFNLAILFLNETHQGYQFASLHESLAWLDGNTGMNRRWDVNFNFTMLRLVSFNLDYYWSHKQTRESITKEDRDKAPTTDKERVSTPAFAEDYNFVYYLAFTLYAPLYVAGPIMTFNDFISQLRYPKSIPGKTLVMWVGRLIFSLLTMEFTMHYMHMVAVSKRQAWDNDPVLQICMIGLFNLILIWLKLMIIWRFFRLWALLDGIEAPENMIRCVTNNYSALGFWRSWHKSYNLWILRYIYIPLGGSRYAIYNIWAVFTFVAVWHDINLKLLAWGWLISFFILPEIIASKVFSKKKWGSWPYYRHLCAVGAVGNILLMMIANLVGFCVGLEGVKNMLYGLFSTAQGWVTMCCCFCAMFVCAQMQFEVREAEKRRGVFLNC